MLAFRREEFPLEVFFFFLLDVWLSKTVVVDIRHHRRVSRGVVVAEWAWVWVVSFR